MDKKIYLSVLAAVVTAAAICLIALLAAPIAKPFAWALIIGISTLPHHNRLARRFPDNPNRSAGLMVLAITVCFILPVAALITMVIQNTADWYMEAERLVLAFTSSGAGALSRFPFADKIIALGEHFGIELSGIGARLAAGTSGYLFNLATNTALNIGELLFTLTVALFMLFFVYRDGERIVSVAITRFTTDHEKAIHYFSEIRSTTTAVTVGTIFTCLVQGVTAGLGYFVAGVPAPVLCGALTALAAIVPVVGTGIVWVPITVLVALNGAFFKAGMLSLWCIIFVGLADNAIRPLAIGAKSHIPVPAVVLGAICGVFALGVLGLILGPVLFAILVTIWHDTTGDIQSTDSDPHNAEPCGLKSE